MRLQDASFQPTKPSTSPVTRTVIGRISAPTSGAAEVLAIEQQVLHAPLPDGYTEIDSVIANREANPKRAAALAKARVRLAKTLTDVCPETLATLRLRCGLSQAGLASRIGNSQPSYSKIEAGKSDVLFSTMEKLAKALAVSIEEVTVAIRNTREKQ